VTLPPLLNNTISPRIVDITDQLICRLKDSEFAIQLDEATFCSHDTGLICYVRCLFQAEKQIVEDLLLWRDDWWYWTCILKVEETSSLFPKLFIWHSSREIVRMSGGITSRVDVAEKYVAVARICFALQTIF